MAYEQQQDYILEIQKGNIDGARIFGGMGEFESGNVDTAGEDVCRWEDVSGPARLPMPSSSGEQMTIISSHNQDKPSGNGVATVVIHYLDDTGVEQAEIVELNGTTGVNTVATNIRFVNDMYAGSVGNNGVSRGNISIYKQGGSIGNDLYNLIAKGGNKSLVPHRMIPLGHTLFLRGWNCTEAQGKRCTFRIRSTDMNGSLIEGVFCFKGVAYLNKNTTGEMGLNETIPALSVVKVSHWDDQAGTEGSCNWWGILIENEEI